MKMARVKCLTRSLLVGFLYPVSERVGNFDVASVPQLCWKQFNVRRPNVTRAIVDCCRFQTSPGPTIAHSGRFPERKGSEGGVGRRMPAKPTSNSLEQVKPASNSLTPVEPAQPVHPLRAAEPVAPIKPVQPVQPVDPVEPIKPIEPESVRSEDPENWKGAGGKFGLEADWRLALLNRDRNSGQSMRGETCLTDQVQVGVREILEKRRTAPAKKVWPANNSIQPGFPRHAT